MTTGPQHPHCKPGLVPDSPHCCGLEMRRLSPVSYCRVRTYHRRTGLKQHMLISPQGPGVWHGFPRSSAQVCWAATTGSAGPEPHPSSEPRPQVLQGVGRARSGPRAACGRGLLGRVRPRELTPSLPQPGCVWCSPGQLGAWRVLPGEDLGDLPAPEPRNKPLKPHHR